MFEKIRCGRGVAAKAAAATRRRAPTSLEHATLTLGRLAAVSTLPPNAFGRVFKRAGISKTFLMSRKS